MCTFTPLLNSWNNYHEMPLLYISMFIVKTTLFTFCQLFLYCSFET